MLNTLFKRVNANDLIFWGYCSDKDEKHLIKKLEKLFGIYVDAIVKMQFIYSVHNY